MTGSPYLEYYKFITVKVIQNTLNMIMNVKLRPRSHILKLKFNLELGSATPLTPLNILNDVISLLRNNTETVEVTFIHALFLNRNIETA